MASPYWILFDPYTGGHHASSLEMGVRAWLDRKSVGCLGIAAPESSLSGYAPLASSLSRHEANRLRGIPLPPSDARGGSASLLQTAFLQGRLLKQIVDSERPDRVILMYADHIQVALAAGLRLKQGVRLSGLYFRPSFHYTEHFGTAIPRRTRWRKKLILRRALRHPAVDRWLSLDPYVVPAIQSMAPGISVLPLPDPFIAGTDNTPPQEVRDAWGIEPGRAVGLFFGVVSARKGIHEVLSALAELPDHAQDRLALVIEGQSPAAEEKSIRQAIVSIRSETRVQIVAPGTFVPQDRIQGMVRAADFMIVAYRRHVGSSNVLIRAASEGIPCVGSDWGLMGHYIRDRRLGLTTDTERASALAGAIEKACMGRIDAASFDPVEARNFASEHTLAGFGDALFG